MAQDISHEQTAKETRLPATRRTVLSGAALAVMGGLASQSLIRPVYASEEDVTILNSAVVAEWQTIAAYDLALSSDLLRAPASALAKTFRDHHQQHADALIGAVKTLGGAAPSSPGPFDFSNHALNNETDVLELAAGLEKGAVSAYLGAVPILDDRELAKVAASILGDEAMHWAVLRSALGKDPVPSAFVS